MKTTLMWRQRHYVHIVIGLLGAVTATLLLVRSGPAATTPPGLGVVSAPWSAAVPLTSHDDGVLANMSGVGRSLRAAHALTTRAGREYFRIDNSSGADCFGFGRTDGMNRLGAVACAPDFPSAARPVLDFSGFRQATEDPASARMTRAEGFAADGVAAIAFRSATGEVVGKTPVVDNVYVLTDPPAEQVVALLALDATGSTIWSENYS